MRLWRLGCFLWAGLLIGIDQLSKYWLRTEIVPQPESLITITSFFNLNHAWNYGTAFSLFWSTAESQRWFLIAGTGLISVALMVWLWRTPSKLTAVAVGSILGGALGNIIDRVQHGAVFDFLQFHLADYYWPSFNIADSAIVCGVALLLWESFKQDAQQRKKHHDAQ